MRHSSFLKRSTSALPMRVCIFLAISSASSRLDVPLEQQRRLDHGATPYASRDRLSARGKHSTFPRRSGVRPPEAVGACKVLWGVLMPKFELVSPYALAGDQPTATDALAAGVLTGDHAQTLLGVTGSGKTMAMARVVELVQKPTLVLCHNKTLAAQLCAEFRDFLPAQRGRVLRLVLRLLSARSVHRPHRHLHRQGLLDQRRDRAAAALGHPVAADPARHAHRGLGLVHLRLGLARRLHGALGRHQDRRRDRPRRVPAQADRHAVPPQRPQPRARARSGCAATRSSSSASTKSWCTASSSSATRSRRSTSSTS